MSVLQRARDAARDQVLLLGAPLYALGGALNVATGGETPTFSIWKAARGGGATPEQTSTFVQAASLVRGHDVQLDDGSTVRRLQPQLPVVNPAGGEFVGGIVEDVASFAGDTVGGAVRGAGEGLGRGLGLPGLLLLGGAAAGGLWLVSKTR